MASGPTNVERVGERLTLVGTVHVDPASANIVNETILSSRPEVVALEIDQSRLDALQNPKTSRISLVAGTSFIALALLEKFAGQLSGSAPGAEMLQAIDAAESVGARVELVDLPVKYTIAGLQRLPWKERFRLFFDTIASLVTLPLGKLDFSGLSSNIEGQLHLFRSRYPALSRLLLDVREEHMAGRIRVIMDGTSGQVVVVLGFGHLSTMARRLASESTRSGFSTSVSWTAMTRS